VSAIQPAAIPPFALLKAYGAGSGYADCYFAEIDSHASLESFVLAFYTTPLFKLEQAILRWIASKPSSDADALQLAQGTSTKFAVWTVEERSSDQLLLADFSGRTRSWLMAQSLAAGDGKKGTRLYFGSAVVPRKNRHTGKQSMGLAFCALLGFHRAYSRLLLRSAVSGLRSTPKCRATGNSDA